MKDYQTKKGRLTKKKLEADFNLADSDDFFGFNVNEPNTGETIWYIVSLILAMFAIAYIIKALIYIF